MNKSRFYVPADGPQDKEGEEGEIGKVWREKTVKKTSALNDNYVFCYIRPSRMEFDNKVLWKWLIALIKNIQLKDLVPAFITTFTFNYFDYIK